MSPDENKMQNNIDWLKTYNLDLEDTVSCDTVDCKENATHFARVKCCTGVLIHCKDCMQKTFKSALWMLKNNKAIVCPQCKKATPAPGWLIRPEKLSLLDVDN